MKHIHEGHTLLQINLKEMKRLGNLLSIPLSLFYVTFTLFRKFKKSCIKN